MKKRIIAFFLSVCMIVSLLAQYVPGVSAKEIDPWENPEAYVGKVAAFNTDDHASFHIFGDPAAYDWETCSGADEYYLENDDDPSMDELPDDSLQLLIKDYVETEVLEHGTDFSRYVWFEVEAAEGYELPEEMADKPYVLYTSTFEREAGDAPLLKIDPVEESEEADTLEEADSNTDNRESLGQEEIVQMENPTEIDLEDDAIEPLYEVPEGMIDPWENPEAYVGSIATFNTVGEESLSSFHVVGNPESYDYATQWEDDAYWLYNEYSKEGLDELPNDYMQMEIIGFYDHVVENSSVYDELNLFADEGEDASSVRFVWYEVKPLVESELPEKMANKPYVLYMTSEDYDLGLPASLSFDLIEEPTDDGRPELAEGFEFEDIQLNGYFSEEVVKFYKTPEGTARTADVNTAELPAFVDVLWKITDTRLSTPEVWYVMKPDSTWPGMETWEFCYVPISHVTLVPAEVTELYEALLGTATLDEYDELFENADSELIDQLTEKHFAALQEHYNTMMENETRTVAGSAAIGTVSVPVEVTGILPAGATVSVEPVSNDSVMDGGFDIENEDEIVLALDIKVLDENGEEWQPKEGRQITVIIGMEELGYEDGKIFRLHHKHGEDIEVFEVFVVMDGKLTVTTNGFSLYVISDFQGFDPENPKASQGVRLDVNPGNNAENAGLTSLTVGETVVFYVEPRNGENVPGNYAQTSAWWIEDPEGAIFYEVYSNRSAGRFGVNAQWIRVTALKETTSPISLRFRYTENIDPYNWQNPATTTVTILEQYYKLSIDAPRAQIGVDEDDVRLYVKDEVNTTGLITATLVDTNGNQVPLGEDCFFSWERNDEAYIIPTAYENGGKSINICVDHAGILDGRRKNVTYTVKATLENGREKEASYTVYYQSEIINSNFESPDAANGTYTFYANGWKDLFWKTTSPGDGVNLSRDVEYASYEGGKPSDFYPNNAGGGNQIAELNAENFGALYQDIITAPNENVSWEFLHAKRDTDRNGEAMFLIMGPTEYAQQVTNYTQLNTLITTIMNANGGRDAVMNELRNGGSIEYVVDETTGKKYQVWYHDAESGSTSANDAWRELSGTYSVPNGQYRTRLFFVTDPGASGKATQYGNLIDSARAGQYKTYLVEYYLESYKPTGSGNHDLVYKYLDGFDEGGDSVVNGETVYAKAMIYSSVALENFATLEGPQYNYLLSNVFINGVNSPYNIRYAGEEEKPRLFIENYATESTNAKYYDGRNNDYEKYDIVMQVFFRDTVIAVQKWVEFPEVVETGKQALTIDEKKKLIDGLIAENGKGYQSFFDLDCATENCSIVADGEINIVKNDPAGWYTGYIPIGQYINGEHSFTLTEEYVSSLEGMEIDSVEFVYYRFDRGERKEANTVTYTNITMEDVQDGENIQKRLNGDRVADENDTAMKDVSIACEKITIDSEENIKIAEVKVTNTYREKEVTINYKAVGNGTVDVQNDEVVAAKEASETFLYYSGKSKSVVATPDQNYTFAGWYLDEACTMPVDENHGYVDYEDDNTVRFTPNTKKMISDDVLEVTYYAKFSIGSLQIIRENAEPGQVFVYEIKDKDDNVVMYATVVVGEDGKGSTEIVNASFGTDQFEGLEYTVTQLNDWSWRHNDTSITLPHKVTEGLHGAMDMTTEFVFKEDSINEYWLNGNSNVKVNKYISAGGTD